MAVAHSRVLRVAIPLLSCYLVWMVSGGVPSLQITLTWSDVRDAHADADADWNPVIWFPYLKTKQTQTQTTMGALAVGGLTNPASNRVPPQTTRPVGAHTNPGWTTIEIGNGVSSITAHGRIDIL